MYYLTIVIKSPDLKIIDRFEYFMLLPHSAPSLILSLAENLASSSLQDGATKWLYYLTGPPHPHPHPHPHPTPTILVFSSLILCGVPTLV